MYNLHMEGLIKFLKSFVYAFNGIKTAYAERNFRIQTIIGIIVLVFSFMVHVSAVERLIIALCITIVLVGEITNSAIERLLDFVSKEQREEIGIIKDLIAGAVLILSFMSFVVGIWIFGNAFFF